MVQRTSDQWISIALSVLLHGALVTALVYGWWMFRAQSRPAPTPAIEARVVDARTLAGSETRVPQPAAAPQPAPAPPPPEDVGPPPPTAEQRAQHEQEEERARQAQEQKAAEERAIAEKAAADRAAAEKAAAAKAAADKAAAAKAAKAAAVKAAADKAQRAADEQDRREREEDLKRSLAADAAEAHAETHRNGAARASWVSMIQAKITHAWLRPPTARAGIDCVLNVTQLAGGEVAKVTIGACNGDQAVRESIEAAVYRASPLPPPPDPSLFDRDLTIHFNPKD